MRIYGHELCTLEIPQEEMKEVTVQDIKNQMREDWLKANPNIKVTITTYP